MQYRSDKYGNPVSALGFGCMRFTQKLGSIDLDKAEREILAAIEAGVNYFDTAYVYGGSEAALGEILARNGLRDRVNIATKLPHYMLKAPDSVRTYFDEELRRLRTDRVDYYLMHMLNDVSTWERLKALGVLRWLEEQKAAGVIRQIGFSYHGNSDMFCALLDAYDWDFCQIQYNYMDQHSQAGITGLKYAASKGIPVVIMEPLRGGRLANKLPKEALRLFEEHPSGRSPAEWGLRWLWDQPEVTCVLSGMNSLEMVAENTRIASEALPGCFSDEERAFLEQAAQAISRGTKVPCTGCRYCMPCPQGVDIPGIFTAYNRRYSDGWYAGLREYIMCTALRKDPTAASNCVKCGKCELHCPQGIEIRKELERARAALEGPAYKAAKAYIRLFMKY